MLNDHLQRPTTWRLWLTLAGVAALAAALLLLGDVRSLVLNTVCLAAGTCAVSLPVGTLLAALLLRTDVPLRRTALTLLAVMLFVPLYVQVSAWEAGFGKQGWVGALVVGLGDEPLLAGLRGAVLVHAAAAVPWVVLIVGVNLRCVRPELEELALLDARGPVVFWRVTLRSAVGSLAVAALWITVVTAGEMTVTDIFVVRTYAEVLYTGHALGDWDKAPLGVWPGVLLVVVLTVAALAACLRLLPRNLDTLGRLPRPFRLGRWRWPAAALTALLLAALIGVPLGCLLRQAGVLVAQRDGGVTSTWSAGHCLAVIAASPWRFRQELAWSLAIGQVAAVVAVVAAVPLAWVACRGGRRAAAVWLVTAVGLAVPGPIVGMTLIWLLNRADAPLLVFLYDRTLFAPWVAVLMRALPLATLVLWFAFRSIPVAQLESAALDGAGPLRRMCRIVLPQRFGAVACAYCVALAVAMGDLSASYLVLPPGVEPLSLRIFRLIHYGAQNELAGLCLAVALMFAVLGALVAWLVALAKSDRAML